MGRMLMRDRIAFGRWIYADEESYYGSNTILLPDDWWTNRAKTSVNYRPHYVGDADLVGSGDSEDRKNCVSASNRNAVKNGRKSFRRAAKRRERQAWRKDIDTDI